MINQIPAEKASKGGISFTTMIVVAAFVMLVGVLLFSTLRLMRAADSSDEPKAPHSVAGMSLGKLVKGEQAIEEVSQLHGKGVGLTGGYIAYYQGNGGSSATVWVGAAENEGQAQRLEEAMSEKIGKGNAYFKNLKAQQISMTDVFTLDGSDGLKHYYYRKGNKVIWVAVGGQRPEEAAKAFISTEW